MLKQFMRKKEMLSVNFVIKHLHNIGSVHVHNLSSTSMDEGSSSMDDIHGWHFHLWMSFLYLWMISLDDTFIHGDLLQFCQHRLPILAKIAPNFIKHEQNLINDNSIHRWAISYMNESVIYGCHPWMEEPHSWMKLSFLDVIHGWRNLIHG